MNKKTIKNLLMMFLIWWVVVNLFAVVVNNRFNLLVDTAYPWIKNVIYETGKKQDLSQLHSHWDSYWYQDIAKNGYYIRKDQSLSNVAFFPLYPLLIFIFSPIFAYNLALTGWFLSSIFLFFAIYYFYKLVDKFHRKINPYSPIIFLLTFPTAVFLNSVYTESLFLFLSIGAFYYMLGKKILYASLFAMLASLTRPNGIFLFIPLLWEYYEQNRKGAYPIIKKELFFLLLNPLGLLLFYLYFYFKFNDFFLFFKIEENWGRNFQNNLAHLFTSDPASITNFSLDIMFSVLGFAITFLVFKKLKISYALYMLISLLFPLSSGTLISIGRFVLVLFPIYIFAAGIKNIFIRQTWLYISVLLSAIYIMLFVNNYWAG